jgi:hypothetical protein
MKAADMFLAGTILLIIGMFLFGTYCFFRLVTADTEMEVLKYGLLLIAISIPSAKGAK